MIGGDRTDGPFEYERTETRLTMSRRGTRWLSNGINGGYVNADSAHNLTVEDGFGRTDLRVYAAERLGGKPNGPTLLTGVYQEHARGARKGPIEVVATAGVSNPATLPVPGNPEGRPINPKGKRGIGTVNIFVGTTQPLSDSGLAGLLATVVEAKTATLLELADCTGTTSDAVVVGCDPADERSSFAGSATEIGNAARICVRDAVQAALDSRYETMPTPETAEYGVETNGVATVFDP